MHNPSCFCSSGLAAVGAALVVLTVGASPLRAEPNPVPDTTGSAASTADISGVLVPEAEPPASAPRQLLVVPRVAVAAVAMPVRGGLTLFEEHHVLERLVDLFFDDTHTYGLYPTIALETSLTPGVGARLVHRNLFGRGGRLRLGADYGGESRFRLEGGVTSPALAGGLLRPRIVGGWQRQPSAVFFGIGDQDIGQPDAAAVALPARAPVAVATRYSQEVVHAELAVEIDPAGPVFAAVSTAYFKRSFGDMGSGPQAGDAAQLGRTDVRFDTATLKGWQDGTSVYYSEAQLGWNSLTTSNSFVSAAAPSTGTKIAAFAGLARSVGGTEVAYTRYGFDGFRYFDLYGGDRVLILRARLEGVADAEDRIPFTDLPRLGGPALMRGYARDRFRDRVAMLASIEYRYPIWRQLGGYLFIDGGRVVPGLSDAGRAVLAPRHIRPGGGGGLEMLQAEMFRMRAQVAGSPEGLFFQLAFEPINRLPTHNYRI
jgi:Omp85 superfamily domain